MSEDNLTDAGRVLEQPVVRIADEFLQKPFTRITPHDLNSMKGILGEILADLGRDSKCGVVEQFARPTWELLSQRPREK